MKSTIAFAASALSAQLATWTVRTYSYIACFAPPAASDPYHELRATSSPGWLIVLGMLVAAVLNLSAIAAVLVVRDAIAGTRSTNFQVAHHASKAFFWGSTCLSLPLVAGAAFLGCTYVQRVFFIALLGPSIASYAWVGLVGIRRAVTTNT